MFYGRSEVCDKRKEKFREFTQSLSHLTLILSLMIRNAGRKFLCREERIKTFKIFQLISINNFLVDKKDFKRSQQRALEKYQIHGA